MKNVYSNKRTILIILSTLTVIILTACAPKKYNSLLNKNPQNDKVEQEEIIEQDLSAPTEMYEKLSEQTAARYESPEKKIKNKQSNTEVIIGQVKLSKSKFSYNPQTRKMQISGHAEVLSDNLKTTLASTEFKLLGSHSPYKGVFPLRPADQNQRDSDIQVRAKVTCLDFNRDDEFDCRKSIIDMFIKHNNKIYTEQLETLNLKNSHQKQITFLNIENSASDTTRKDENSTNHSAKKDTSTELKYDENGLQVEGKAHEIKGRYVGTAATAKLDQLFDVISDTLKKKRKNSQTPNSDSDDDNDHDNSETNEPYEDEHQSANEFNNNFSIDQTGRMIKKNQAFGDYDDGKLRNASSLMEQQKALKLESLFEVSFPQRGTYYGTQEMMDIIELIGKKLSQSQDKLYVANISKVYGGRLPPSVSHQIGMDVDLGYPTPNGRVKFPVVVDRNKRLFNTQAYSTQKTYELFKFLINQTTVPVARIFSDQHIINDLCTYAKRHKEFEGSNALAARKVFNTLSHVDGHGDHFHLRLMCTDNQPACNKVIYPKSNNCQ